MCHPLQLNIEAAVPQDVGRRSPAISFRSSPGTFDPPGLSTGSRELWSIELSHDDQVKRIPTSDRGFADGTGVRVCFWVMGEQVPWVEGCPAGTTWRIIDKTAVHGVPTRRLLAVCHAGRGALQHAEPGLLVQPGPS